MTRDEKNRQPLHASPDQGVSERPNRAASLFIYVVLGFVVVLFLWAATSKIDEITRAEGKVVPSQNSQIVQSLEGGILRELLVQKGDQVKKNQILMRLSDITFASEERGVEAKMLSLRARKARLEAEAEGKDFIVPADIRTKAAKIAENEQNLFLSRKEEYKNALLMLDNKAQSIAAQISEQESFSASARRTIDLIQKELAITSKMVAQKAVPEIDEIRLRRDLNKAQGDVNSAQERKSSLRADLAAIEKQKKDQADKFRSQALGELNDVETNISAIQENLNSIGDRVDRTEIRSPVDGVVNSLALTTIGGVVEPAMRLAEIIPSGDDLKIQAKVSPNDIAFLKIGQAARVKVTAYDAARYGFLGGRLTRIGANSISEPDGRVYFEIELQADRSYLGTSDHPLPISSGMLTEVHVITGKRTILEYFLKPFLKLKDRAFSER